MILCIIPTASATSVPSISKKSYTKVSSTFNPATVLTKSDISKVIHFNIPQKPSKSLFSKNILMNAITPQGIYYGDIPQVQEVAELACVYQNGAWSVDESNVKYHQFGIQQGYSTTIDFPYTMAIVLVYEPGNYAGRFANYLDFNTNPATQYDLPLQSINVIKEYYNGNTVTGRLVQYTLPKLIYAKGGSFRCYGDTDQILGNWIHFGDYVPQ